MLVRNRTNCGPITGNVQRGHTLRMTSPVVSKPRKVRIPGDSGRPPPADLVPQSLSLGLSHPHSGQSEPCRASASQAQPTALSRVPCRDSVAPRPSEPGLCLAAHKGQGAQRMVHPSTFPSRSHPTTSAETSLAHSTARSLKGQILPPRQQGPSLPQPLWEHGRARWGAKPCVRRRTSRMGAGRRAHHPRPADPPQQALGSRAAKSDPAECSGPRAPLQGSGGPARFVAPPIPVDNQPLGGRDWRSAAPRWEEGRGGVMITSFNTPPNS